MTFDDLVFNTREDGVYCTVYFPNGYGASIIRTNQSYGGSNGLYEMAVLKNGFIDYDTEITDDVLGHLDEQDVTTYLERIQKL